MEYLLNHIDPLVKDLLNLPALPSDKHRLTLWMIIHASVLLGILILFTKILKGWLIEKVLSKTQFELGLRYALGAIASYIVLILGFFVILDTAGIDTTALTVVIGALGLGLSLSLQTIMSNCFAGLYILVERRIKVGDRVQIGELVGRVKDISLRASYLITNENTLVIVPNSDFISSRVINLSYDGKATRIVVPIAIDPVAEPEPLIKFLIQVLEELPGVAKEPPVEILFKSFSKDQQNFVAIAWTEDNAQKPELLQSKLNLAIANAIKQWRNKDHTESSTSVK